MPNIANKPLQIPFSVPLPDVGLPPSFADPRGSIGYAVRVMVSYQEGMKIMRTSKVAEAASHLHHQEPYQENKVMYTLTIPRRALRIGEGLEMEIHVLNMPPGKFIKTMNVAISSQIEHFLRMDIVLTDSSKANVSVEVPIVLVPAGGERAIEPEEAIAGVDVIPLNGGKSLQIIIANQSVVCADYDPSMPDELELRVNDIVVLNMVHDDGWAHGTNLTTNQTGMLPLAALHRDASVPWNNVQQEMVEVEQRTTEFDTDENRHSNRFSYTHTNVELIGPAKPVENGRTFKPPKPQQAPPPPVPQPPHQSPPQHTLPTPPPELENAHNRRGINIDPRRPQSIQQPPVGQSLDTSLLPSHPKPPGATSLAPKRSILKHSADSTSPILLSTSIASAPVNAAQANLPPPPARTESRPVSSQFVLNNPHQDYNNKPLPSLTSPILKNANSPTSPPNRHSRMDGGLTSPTGLIQPNRPTRSDFASSGHSLSAIRTAHLSPDGACLHVPPPPTRDPRLNRDDSWMPNADGMEYSDYLDYWLTDNSSDAASRRSRALSLRSSAQYSLPRPPSTHAAQQQQQAGGGGGVSMKPQGRSRAPSNASERERGVLNSSSINVAPRRSSNGNTLVSMISLVGPDGFNPPDLGERHQRLSGPHPLSTAVVVAGDNDGSGSEAQTYEDEEEEEEEIKVTRMPFAGLDLNTLLPPIDIGGFDDLGFDLGGFGFSAPSKEQGDENGPAEGVPEPSPLPLGAHDPVVSTRPMVGYLTRADTPPGAGTGSTSDLLAAAAAMLKAGGAALPSSDRLVAVAAAFPAVAVDGQHGNLVASSQAELDAFLVSGRVSPTDYIKQRDVLSRLAGLDAMLLSGEVEGQVYIARRDEIMGLLRKDGSREDDDEVAETARLDAINAIEE
ncbi:hypothetical protein HK101_011000 [Irineochytrium annulatum]|nr:hypothetical protein HK101_011000 [Irineochytrium annulatum]